MSSASEHIPVDIDVCIITYRRPALLRKTLETLLSQQTNGEFNFAINIVDNDATGAARHIVDGFRGSHPMIRYAIEPEMNISLARNRSLALGNAGYIAILDDDEEADSSWLHSLFTCCRTSGADLVFGPIEFFFDGRVPEWVRDANIRTIQEHPDGARSGFLLRSGNCFFRRAVLAEVQPWFRTEFGGSGGGDSEFFERLLRNGYRAIWCAGAVTRERLMADRMTFAWMFSRRMRQGMNYSRRARMEGNETGYSTKLKHQYYAAWRGFSRATAALFRLNYRRFIRKALGFAFHFGFLLNAHFGFYYRRYR